jgi:NAD(P)-dependent dehydrogenase (short-subunit alcohol dehydrogenase family)
MKPSMQDRGVAVLMGAEACHGPALANGLARAGFALAALPADTDAPSDPSRQSDGEVAVLVINAPVVRTGLAFDDITDAAFDAAMQEQVFDVVAAVQRMLPHMASGARMVLVGARGHLGAWGGAHRMAASAALVALVRSLALELAPAGIRVNLVAGDFVDAGAVETPDSEAIAHAVLFFADPHCGVSGESMLLDGNAALRMSESRRPANADRGASAST